jgi:hypothetical protein
MVTVICDKEILTNLAEEEDCESGPLSNDIFIYLSVVYFTSFFSKTDYTALHERIISE